MDQFQASNLLGRLGLDLPQRGAFFAGDPVVYPLVTEGDPGVGLIEWAGTRLRSGIIEIRDIGGGFEDLLRFRDLSKGIAVAVGAVDYELFGGAIINDELAELLVRQRFRLASEPVPEGLGGGTMEILTRVFLL